MDYSHPFAESDVRGCLGAVGLVTGAILAIVAVGVGFAVVFLVLPAPLQAVVGIPALILATAAWVYARMTRGR